MLRADRLFGLDWWSCNGKDVKKGPERLWVGKLEVYNE
jgi:hypothetical protein